MNCARVQNSLSFPRNGINDQVTILNMKTTFILVAAIGLMVAGESSVKAQEQIANPSLELRDYIPRPPLGTAMETPVQQNRL